MGHVFCKINEIYAPHDPISVVFAGDEAGGLEPRVWHSIDLRDLGVSAEAALAQLSAHMIITDLTDDIENLTCTVRRPGSVLNHGNYQLQQVSVFKLDGRRGRQTVVVPLVNGCFELYWDFTSAGVPDASPSTALINMTLDWWGRWADLTPQPEPEPEPEPEPIKQTIIVPPGGIILTLLPEAG